MATHCYHRIATSPINKPAHAALTEFWISRERALVEGDGIRRHLRVYSDGPGHWYVRAGKHGTRRHYLTTARHWVGIWVFGYDDPLTPASGTR